MSSSYKRIFVFMSFVSLIAAAVESVAASFPLYLKGTAPEQVSATINVNKPAGAIDGFITIKAFDADHRNEGDLVINGKSPIALWGASGVSSNNQRWTNIKFKTPASYWQAGSNTLLFKHKKSGGFIIESVAISFTSDSSGTSGTSSSSQTSSSGPVVKFSIDAIDFGSQVIGGISNPIPVTLSNSGSAPLVISTLYASSANFTQTNNCNNYLPAGGACRINVTFIPTTARSYAEKLVISSDATGSPHRVSLAGIGSDGNQISFSGNGNTVFHVDFENRAVNTAYTKAQIIEDFNANEKDGAIRGPQEGNMVIVSDPARTGRGKVLRVRHPAGEIAKGGGKFKARFAPDNANKRGSARFDDVYFAYDLYLSPNTKSMMMHKLPGLITGTMLEASHGTGGPEPEGIKSFTALMQAYTSGAQVSRPHERALAMYTYDANKVMRYDYLDTIHPAESHRDHKYTMPLGRWFTIEQRVKLNTADSNNAYNSAKDKKDGLAEVWINGVKMSTRAHLWRWTNTMKADGFWFYSYYNNTNATRRGGQTPPKEDQYEYYDNFRISTSPITH